MEGAHAGAKIVGQAARWAMDTPNGQLLQHSMSSAVSDFSMQKDAAVRLALARDGDCVVARACADA